MKPVILIFALLNLITIQDTDECYEWFHKNLEEQCISNGLTECKYNIFDKKCVPINSCAEGNGDEELCKKLIHPDFHLKKCKYDTEKNECKEALKIFADYNKANPDASSGLSVSVGMFVNIWIQEMKETDAFIPLPAYPNLINVKMLR